MFIDMLNSPEFETFDFTCLRTGKTNLHHYYNDNHDCLLDDDDDYDIYDWLLKFYG